MVIITGNNGRFANQLFIFAHFIASAKEHRYKLVNLAFKQYEQLFDSNNQRFLQKSSSLQISFVKSCLVSCRLYSICLSLTKIFSFFIFRGQVLDIRKSHDAYNKTYNLNNPTYIHLAKTSILITSGWLFRNDNLFKKHSNLIRDYFKPALQYLKTIEDIEEEARSKGNILVGVHIRRTDYARFNEGKFYFENKDYVHIITELCREFPVDSKNVILVICSDEKISETDFRSFSCYFSKNEAIVDLYLLAKCDYIIGPPSTFTLWASFYGKKPLYHIQDINTKIELNKFQVFE